MILNEPAAIPWGLTNEQALYPTYSAITGRIGFVLCNAKELVVRSCDIFDTLIFCSSTNR